MGEGVEWKELPYNELERGKAETLLEGNQVALVCTGPVVNVALRVAEKYPGKVGVYNFRYIKPLDEDMLEKIAESYCEIITIEDGCKKGGLYGAVCEHVMKLRCKVNVSGLGIEDEFIGHARQNEQHAYCMIDFDGIEKSLKKVFENQK